VSNRMEYKEFDRTTLKGVKDAERYQQALYNRYDKVEVRPIGFSKTAVWAKHQGFEVETDGNFVG